MSQNPLKGLLEGTVMVDETHIGGKARPKRGEKRGRGYRHPNKATVVALVERGGHIKSWPIADVTAKTLQTAIRDHVSPKAAIQTDELLSYKGVGKWFEGGHETVNHSKYEFVRGDVSTNEAENFALPSAASPGHSTVSKETSASLLRQVLTAGTSAR